MNKLEEYKEKRSNHTLEVAKEEFKYGDDPTPYSCERYWGMGFDAYHALDLPVKFAKWLVKAEEDAFAYLTDEDRYEIPDFKYETWTTKELFDYWLNNIWEGV